MKITDIEKESILNKRIELEKLKKEIKKEIIGIDKIVDEVVDTISPFYLFPQSLKRPIVVNLWGMTATGKTSLVNKIVDFLKLGGSFYKFDVGEYCEDENMLKHELSENIKKNDSKNLVLLFDEFQLGRTINESGSEINRNSLRPMWEMIDSGIINKYNTVDFYLIDKMLKTIDKCIELGIQTDKNGFIVKGEEIYNSIVNIDYEYYRPCDFKICLMIDYSEDDSDTEDDTIKKSKYYGSDDATEFYMNGSRSSKDKKKFISPRFIKKDMYQVLYDTNPGYFNHINDYFTHIKKLSIPLEDLSKLIKKEFFDHIPLMSKEDYSQSLIFCLGNLDEAYTMTHSTDPDADADMFHEFSLKITVPKIKQALASRFRMEQIGRLGNNHFIYPSLNKNAYIKIIKKYLSDRQKYFKTEYDLNINFSQNVHDIIYKEGVFPTQGVRPLLSTINNMIDSYSAKFITDLIIGGGENLNKFKWDYNFVDKKYMIKSLSVSEQELIFEYGVELKIDQLRESDGSEEQTFTAVHEAGHAVISSSIIEIAPLEVLSKTASLAEGFCRTDLPETRTRDFMLKEIMLCLGGLEAEKLIFGEDSVGEGGYSDLSRATTIAVGMVKELGMDKFPYMVSSITDRSVGQDYVKEATSDIIVASIITECQKKTKKCLEDNKKVLLTISDVLSNKSKITDKDIKEIYKSLGIEIKWKTKDNYYGFKSVLKSHLDKL